MDKFMQANAEMAQFSRNYMDQKRDLPIRPSEMGVLNIIAYTPGPHTAMLLAERLHVSRPMITAHLNVLLKHEYIEKQQASEDKRMYYLQLTQKGRQLVSDAQLTMNEHMETLESGMGSEKFSQLVALLKTANEIMNIERSARFGNTDKKIKLG